MNESVSKSAIDHSWVARPEFREVANFAYYDFVRNAQILGNSDLEKTDVYNLDLKYEFYPTIGENISFSIFGKNFIRPIEQVHTDVEFMFLDGDRFEGTADYYNIEYYPTMVYFENGEEKKRIQSTNIKEIEKALF